MATWQQRNKYKNRKAEIDGIRFDSIKEARRYRQLRAMEETGEISELRLQVTFYLSDQNKRDPEGHAIRPVKYVADFVYTQDGQTIVEDVKGYKDSGNSAYRIFRIKQKLMYDRFNIWIREV